MNIPVYFVTNWDMVAYTTTTMVSLLSNTKCNCDFYIMDCGLSASDRKRLLTLKEQFPNLKSLSFSTVDIARFKGMNSWYYGMLDAWAMLLFPESFPDVHGKVIHIESDTLVVDDIEKLYNEIAAWAEDDFRSVNGQIEYLLTECVRQREKNGKYVSEHLDQPLDIDIE